MPSILMLGPPLSGKSTHGARLAAALQGAFVSTGQVIREHLAAVTDAASDPLSVHVKAGTCAPAAVTDAIFTAAFAKLASAPAVIIDGYPREIDQIEPAAEVLRKAGLAPLSVVVLLEIDRDDVVKRLASREARADDAVALSRFDKFAAQASALVAHFERLDLLVRVDAAASLEDVFSDVLDGVRRRLVGQPLARRTPAVRLRDLLLAQRGVVSEAQLTHFRDSSLAANSANRTGVLRRFVYVVTNNDTKLSEHTDVFATYGIECLSAPFLSALEWDALAAAGPPAELLAAARAAKLPPIDTARSSLGGADRDAERAVLAALELGEGRATGAQLEALFYRALLMCRELGSKIPFALLREQSELLAPSGERPSSMEHGVRCINRATLRVWRRVPETKLCLISTFVTDTTCTVDVTQRQTGSDVFGWDSIVVPDGTSLSFYALKRQGLKVAARQSDISAFVTEFVHFDEGRDLNHTPQHPKRCVDFELDAARVMAANDIARDPTVIRVGGSCLAQTALDSGAYLRFPFNRRHANYFLTPVAGLPATPKDDFLHELTFFSHDIGHLVIQELLFVGRDSYADRSAFVCVRMLSEAMTMVLADMFLVDAIVASKRAGGFASRVIPDDYDFKKRRIYPLFQATGLKLAEAATTEERLANLLVLMQANANCLMKGDDTLFTDLITKNGGDLGALARHKEKYAAFFASDYTWACSNFDLLARTSSDSMRRWWAATAALRAASRLPFESTDEFLARVELPAGVARLDELDPSAMIDVALRFLFKRQLVDGAFLAPAVRATQQRAAAAPVDAAVELDLAPFWHRNSLAFVRYAIGQMGLFAAFSFVDSAHATMKRVEQVALAVAHQTWAWRDLADGDHDAAARLAWLLARIGEARALVDAFLRELEQRHFVTAADVETWSEQYSLFPPLFLSYDFDGGAYEPLRSIFEREFSRDVRWARFCAEYARVNGLEKPLSKSEARFLERTATLVEGSGGVIDSATFVMQVGVMLLARSESRDASLGGAGCHDPATANATFLVAGASVETMLEFVAHGEARVARLTSSRTAAMRHPLIRVLPDRDPAPQKAYHTSLRSKRAQLRHQLRVPPSPWVGADSDATAGRGAEEIDNNAESAAKAAAFVITMSVLDWHKTLIGRCSREGNESDVVRIACTIADALHALFPAHIWPSERYRGAANSLKYAAAAPNAPAPALIVPAAGVVSELKLTRAAHRLFNELGMSARHVSDTDRIAEFGMRLTYLSFPDSPDYDAKDWLHRIVASTGHLSVVGCARVNVVLELAADDADTRRFLDQQALKHGGVVTAISSAALHLSFSVKQFAAILNAATGNGLVSLATNLREHLHAYEHFFI